MRIVRVIDSEGTELTECYFDRSEINLLIVLSSRSDLQIPGATAALNGQITDFFQSMNQCLREVFEDRSMEIPAMTGYARQPTSRTISGSSGGVGITQLGETVEAINTSRRGTIDRSELDPVDPLDWQEADPYPDPEPNSFSPRGGRAGTRRS